MRTEGSPLSYRRCTDIAACRARVESLLMAEEALNNLALGILSGQSGRNPFLGLVEDPERPTLVMLMTPPHAVVVYAAPGYRPDALELAVSSLLSEGIPVPGVMGPRDLATDFARSWAAHTGRSWRVGMEQKVYRLDEVRSVRLASGELAPATPGHETLVCEWSAEFAKEAGTGQSAEQARERTQELLAGSRVFLWMDGQPVSMAVTNRSSRGGANIGGVYTPPPLRRRGYATACVAELSRLLLARGHRFCTLYTDASNPTSNSIYRKIGYGFVGDSIHYEFG